MRFYNALMLFLALAGLYYDIVNTRRSKERPPMPVGDLFVLTFTSEF